MPLIETKGAASAQGFGEFATSSEKLYIESCFSTWLYTGNGSTQTITNGINLADEGGLVWTKIRGGSGSHFLVDTVRGNTKTISSNTDSQEGTTSTGITAFNSDGYALGSNGNWNPNTFTTVSWTFRKQEKFFDVVTYTGNGSNRTISHNLGSVPGCIIVKRTDTAADWQVYHRSIANTEYLVLNSTAAKATGTTRWNSTTPTSTEFSLGTDATVNDSGGTYVAYLFAHDAGAFGLSGTDNVISCGSYTGNGSATGPVITLGYEPQWVMIKRTNSTGNWIMWDAMRGAGNANDARLFPNLTSVESAGDPLSMNATGFQPVGTGTIYNASGSTYIYIAIRRGPMKVPTSGTSVFSPIAYTGNGTEGQYRELGVTADLLVSSTRNTGNYRAFFSRLIGSRIYLHSDSTSAETDQGNTIGYYSIKGLDSNTGYYAGEDSVSGLANYSGWTYVNWAFRRAPGFMDVVCYTGTGSARTVAHNLGAVPELMIVKDRSTAGNGRVYTESGGAGVYLRLFSTSSDSGNTATTTIWNNTAPTSSVFSVGTSSESNFNARTYVAYLFGTVAGVSKVGSYTGTGATQTINCGFSSGSRFVLIKKSTSTAPDRNWYVWDSARGITSGNDPYLLLNTTDAEVTSTDYINTAASGFQIVTSDDAVNASGVTYIFLAIA